MKIKEDDRKVMISNPMKLLAELFVSNTTSLFVFSCNHSFKENKIIKYRMNLYF
jgi:hypothetical protein